jgi:hypothetical protein
MVCMGCAQPDAMVVPTWTLRVDGVDGVEGKATTVTLPTHLDDGRVPDRNVRYTLATDVTLPPSMRGRDLEFVQPALLTNVSLDVDGAPVRNQGVELARGYRTLGPHVWRLPAEATKGSALHLVMIVEHRWTQSAWIDVAPEIVLADELPITVRVARWLTPVGSICGATTLALIGITWLIVTLVDRRRAAYFWFGLQSIGAAFYALFAGGFTQLVFGRYDLPVMVMALTGAAVSSLRFTHAFFELRRPSRAWDAAFLVCGIVLPAVASGPFVATRVLGVPVVALVAATIVRQLVLCTRLVMRHHDRWSALIFLASWFSLALTAWPDCIVWVGWGDVLAGGRSAPVGLASFAFFCSLLLSRNHIRSLNRSDALNTELAARVAQLDTRRVEIEHLNTELRRQIADRAGQIYSALALRQSTAPEKMRLVAGEMVQGRYRVERELGAGGMGSVYEVTRVSDGLRLALKLTHEAHGVALARLAREAQIAATVAHPNVVRIHDVDVATSGFLFLVMDLVPGRSLCDERSKRGDVAWALAVLGQIALGLEALHAAGVIHRDVTPANVLVSEGDDGAPHVTITDFGISRLAEDASLVPPASAVPSFASMRDDVTAPLATRGLGSSGAHARSLTRTGYIAGTPIYMAPELVMGAAAVTPAVDSFSFGIVAFELLVGRRPFAESVALATLDLREVAAPPTLASLWPAAPRDLARMIDACLSMDPLSRPTASDLARALGPMARGRDAARARASGD